MADLSELKASFDRRSEASEFLDDLSFSGGELHRALDEIALVNRFLGGLESTRSGIEELVGDHGGREVRIVDLGCGGADVPRALIDWARRKRLPISIVGYDANPACLRHARSQSVGYRELEFREADVTNGTLPAGEFDIAVLSLFAHHLSDETLVTVLRELRRKVRLGTVINDLHRHPLAFLLFRLAGFVFRASPVTVYDGSVSILRGFRRKELERLLKGAGFERYRIRWRWAFRWQVILYHGPS